MNNLKDRGKNVTEKDKISFDLVRELVIGALNDFYENDAILLDYINEREAVSERCMVFHIGCYMIERMKAIPVFKNFQLDCEYNRNLGDPKLVHIRRSEDGSEELHKAYPDLIIHKRQRNDDNLLVIEFKKGDAPKDALTLDIDKLRYFTRQDGEYSYKYGLYIALYKQRSEIRLYQNGAERKELLFTREQSRS